MTVKRVVCYSRPVSKYWLPNVSPKQLRMILEKRQLLLSDGPRRCGKTIGLCHKTARHLWETPGASFMMIGQTITKNATEGAWVDLRKTVLPQWIEAGFGMQFLDPHTHEPMKESRDPVFMEGTTHRLYMDVSNRYAHRDVAPDLRYSRVFLDSLPDETPTGDKADHKFKGKRFSGIWVTELSDFKYRSTLDILTECLRMIHLPDTMHQLISDTNPAPEGEDSWIWKIWYWFRNLNLDQLEEDEKEALREMFSIGGGEDGFLKVLPRMKKYQSKLALHHFTLNDNPFISQDIKDDIWSKYSYNPSLRDRYFNGIWTKSTGEGLFSDVWRPNIQVIGRARGLFNPHAELLVPQEDAIELGMGWDPGPTNFAAVFVEKFSMEVDVRPSRLARKDKNETETTGPTIKTAFAVIDEFISLGQPVKFDDAIEEIMAKIDFWENFLGHKVLWRHWADASAFDRTQSIAETTEAREIFTLSDGKIVLRSFKKLPGSIAQRIDHMTRLLFEGRLFISAAKCPQTIEMFERIKRNSRGGIDRAVPWKHSFDALSYYCCMESWNEISASAFSHARREKFQGRIVSTRL